MNSTQMAQRWETVKMHHWSLNLLKNGAIFHQQRVLEETMELLHVNSLTGILHSLKVNFEVFLESKKKCLKILNASDT
jgi:hypothetical protein